MVEENFSLINNNIDAEIKQKTNRNLWITIPSVFLVFLIALFVWQPWKSSNIDDTAINKTTKEQTIEEPTTENTEVLDNLQLDMIFVKGGTFKMGSNDGESDEKPIHDVRVSDFYIGKYEVISSTKLLNMKGTMIKAQNLSAVKNQTNSEFTI